MNNRRKEQMVKRLCIELGVEKVLAALPQQEVKQALRLVSVGELASKLGINYGCFQSRIGREVYPYPEVQLRRRAYYSPEQAEAISEMVSEERERRNLTLENRTA